MTPTLADPALVRLVQSGLEHEGLYSGEIDGIYGPATSAAYQSFLRFERYDDIVSLKQTLSPGQMADLAKFLKCWKQFAAAYARVAAIANVPAELVAALHWRESGGNFSTYLCNGDPLGRPTVHEPKGLNFSAWEPAAVDAIMRERNAFVWSGIEQWTHDLRCMCVFAEAFNGEGYAEMHPPVPDPYVLAGTSGYTSGKYVADGVYDPKAVDAQLGVLVMLRAIVS